LLNNGANIHEKDNCGYTALHWASNKIKKWIEDNEIPIKEPCEIDLKLLSYIYINMADQVFTADHLCTTLHLASRYGHNTCIMSLLNAGAHGKKTNVNEKGDYGFTALHLASKKGHHECVTTLLNNGANVNEKDNYGSTPLHLASRYGREECIITLLNAGAHGNRTNVDEKNYKGFTALHLASFNGHYECVIVLLNAGANIHEKDNNGSTVLDRASNKIKDTIKKWIEENEIPIKEPCEN
jgi:ankyrin repeat protein